MAGTVVIIVVIAGVIWFSHKKRVASDGLTTKERKEWGYAESEILSMLRQHGGPMMQREVIDYKRCCLSGWMKSSVSTVGLEDDQVFRSYMLVLWGNSG